MKGAHLVCFTIYLMVGFILGYIETQAHSSVLLIEEAGFFIFAAVYLHASCQGAA